MIAGEMDDAILGSNEIVPFDIKCVNIGIKHE